MTSGPPENPPPADFQLPLCEHYPPHGFPPYLGLGVLDKSSLRLEPGESVAEYRQGDDLVYRVRGAFDPRANDGVATACAANGTTWEIEEFVGGAPWRKTAGYETLSQVFFHHHAEQLPTENPRIADILRRLTEDYRVAVRCKDACTYLMFPAGYLYAIRVPLTDGTLENFKAFLSEAVDDLPIPWPAAESPQSVAIIKADRTFRATFERGIVCDVTVPLVRLTQTLDRLRAAKAAAAPVHLRPEVIYAHERHQKFTRVYPGRLRDGIVAYEVIPIDSETPPPKDLALAFGVDASDLFSLVEEALQQEPQAQATPGGDDADN